VTTATAVATAGPLTGAATPAARARPGIAVGFALAVMLVAQLLLIFTKSVNWDEFFHLSQVYELQRGTLVRDFQVLHVRLFAWLPATGLDVVGQVLAGRLGMLLFELASLAAIAVIAGRRSDRETGLLAALAWLGGGYVFLHAFSFRPDPMATACLLVALAILDGDRPGRRALVAAPILIAFAFAANLKSGLYLPVFAGVLAPHLLEPKTRRQRAIHLIAASALAAMWFGLFYVLHRAGISHEPGANLAKTGSNLRFFQEGLFPRGIYTVKELLIAPGLTAALVISAVLHARGQTGWTSKAAPWLLLAPLAAVAVYRNSFPYYFAFALAPAAIFAAPGLAWLRTRYGLIATIAVLTVPALLLGLTEPRDVLPRQQRVLSVIDQMFPKDAEHLSYSGMAADRPRPINMLVSGVGLERYGRRGRAAIAESIAQDRLRFVLIDHAKIYWALSDEPGEERLIPADVAAFRSNFAHFWGPVWLPGKSIAGESDFMLQRPGRYVLDGQAMTIDGKSFAKGSVIGLAAGPHRVGGPVGASAVLWKGEQLPPVLAPLDDGQLYTDF